MVYFFLLDFIFVAHLHTALSANAEPRWEYVDATKVASKVLQSNSVSCTLVSNYAAEFNKGHFGKYLRGHIIAIEPHKSAFLLVVR